MYFLKRIQVTLSLHGGVVREPKYVQYPLSSKPAEKTRDEKFCGDARTEVHRFKIADA